jgi:uncharacterized protein
MHRRNILTTALSSLGATLLAVAARADTRPDQQLPAKLKVVYHLSEYDRVGFVLGNIRNHYAGAGGPDRVTIALVVHGPALRAFQSASASPDVGAQLGKLRQAGIGLAACGNTMQAMKIDLPELLPGFSVAEEGGVVRIAELQSQGYLYIRP